MMTQIKTPQEINAMREGGKMLAHVLQVLSRRIAPGMTTQDLDNIAREELKKLGGEPAFLGYYGFPAVLCVSVNDEVVHGIPSSKIIKEGDVVGMDFGVRHKGLITDAAISVIVGQQKDSAKQELVAATHLALEEGIAAVKAGCQVGDISAAIQEVLDGAKLSIVRDLVGHGVGHELHEDPNIPNFGQKGIGPELKAGMTIAIEPMATLGGYRVHVEDDHWTVRTNDGSWSAHFEHTVLITDSGAEILTAIN
jgi:methionyl aminopeptidase